MEDRYNLDDLFTELDHNLRQRPSTELLHKMEQFAKKKSKQVEKFTIGQILSIAASFLLIALINFSVVKPNLDVHVSVDDEEMTYQFIPLNSLYNE